MLPNDSFNEKILKKIEASKKQHHKYVAVSSGTAFKINREFLKDVAPKFKMEAQRALHYDWIRGSITLGELKAFIKENAIIYRDDNAQRIIHSINNDLGHTPIMTTTCIIPRFASGAIKEKWPNFNFIIEEEVLFLD